MFEFAYPYALALAILPLILRPLMAAHRVPAIAVRVPFFEDLVGGSDLAPEAGSVIAHRSGFRWALLIVGWLLLVAALARPQWVGEAIERTESARDLMIAVDISGSMNERDFRGHDGQPERRLDAVKSVVGDFIEGRAGDRVGLIVFGSRAFLQAPFTTDLALTRDLLNEIDVNMAGPNTAIGDAIGLAIRVFETSELKARELKKRVLILLTDGSDTGSKMTPLNAARIAADEGVTIHTVGVGDPDSNADDKADLALLTTLAEAANGTYFSAADTNGLKSIYDEIDRLSERAVTTLSYRPKESLAHWPAGMVAVLAALVLFGTGAGQVRRKAQASSLLSQ